MLINVDQLWKPASQPPTKSGLYISSIENRASGQKDTTLVYYTTKEDSGISQKGYWHINNAWNFVTHWMNIPPSPGAGNMMEIPSEATLQLYGSDSELACIKVEPREGQNGAAIAVLIRTTLSNYAASMEEDNKDDDDFEQRDDEVTVSLQAYDSQDDNTQWRNRSSLSFVDAQYNLERENNAD
jgi:hypothetical protein